MFNRLNFRTAAPVITRVRDIDPEQADIDLEGAGLGSWIVIQGSNLAGTQEIYFNNYSAYFNPSYVTGSDIVIQILTIPRHCRV